MHGQQQRIHHAGGEHQILRLDRDAVVAEIIVDQRGVVRVIVHGVAQCGMLQAAAQRIHDALGAGEVHVRDEHRDHALRRGVPLKAMRAPAIHAAEQFFVKIHVSVLDSIMFYIK